MWSPGSPLLLPSFFRSRAGLVAPPPSSIWMMKANALGVPGGVGDAVCSPSLTARGLCSPVRLTRLTWASSSGALPPAPPPVTHRGAHPPLPSPRQDLHTCRGSLGSPLSGAPHLVKCLNPIIPGSSASRAAAGPGRQHPRASSVGLPTGSPCSLLPSFAGLALASLPLASSSSLPCGSSAGRVRLAHPLPWASGPQV